MQRTQIKTVIQSLVVAVLYVITGQLGFLLAINPGNVTAVWPPSGVAVAAVLFREKSSWFGIWLGAFAVNLLFFAKFGPVSLTDMATAFAIALGSTLQA